MTTVAEAFALAGQQVRAGNWSQAEWWYRQILTADPSHFEAANALGITVATLGRPAEAVPCFRQALQWQPQNAGYHSNLGNVLSAIGQHEEAAACHWHSIQLDPGSAVAHSNLGSCLHALNRLEEAKRCFQKAVQLDPNYPEAHNNLGTALDKEGHIVDAAPCYEQAIRLRPDYADAWYNLANVLKRQVELEEAVHYFRETVRLRPDFPEAYNNMATLLYALNRFDEALACCHEALRMRPDFPDAQANLATITEDFRQRVAPQASSLAALPCSAKLDEASRCYRETLRLRPNHAEACNNLGSILDRQGKFAEAEIQYRESIRLRPNNAEAISNLGIALLRQNKLDDAGYYYDEALRQQPDLGAAHWNRSLLWLLRGDFQRGWAEYEWRWTQPKFIKREFSQPRWDGSALDGKTILLYAEQGLGDTLQFIRYATMAADRGAKVIVECQRIAIPLLAGVRGIHRLVAQDTPLPPFDVQLPLLSVPGVLHTELGTIPGAVPYLKIDPALVERWRREIGTPKRLGGRRLQVGVVWQGNPANSTDRQRSIPLSHFAVLAKLDGVQLISLQKGPGTEQLHALQGRFPIVDLESRLGPPAESLTNIAAILESLDLVISCDTAIAHLAGALAVPVWLAIAVVPDWRWLLGREDTPWYPTMRLFRQTRLDEWKDVFQRMAAALSEL